MLLRFVQGFALGGEWGGAVLLVTEHSPNRSRGFWGSFPQAGIPMGNLLATIVLLLLSATLSEGEFLAWGWRVGFWLSVIIVGVGYYIRTKVSDSPIFEAAKAEAEQRADAGYGVAEVFRHYPRGVFTAMGLRVAENILYYMVVTFSITYLAHIGVDTTEILALLFCAHLLHIVLIPSIGRLADRIGRKPVYIAGAALTIAWPFVAFPLFDTGAAPIILAGIMIGMAVHALMYAPQPAILTEMFPTRMRYSGVSLGYQVTAIFAGSWAPLIGAALLRAYDSWQPIALYVAGAGAISLVSALVMTETRGISLLAIDRADRERTA
ncbi:MFS transporter [Rhizorhabdus histidinilytica]